MWNREEYPFLYETHLHSKESSKCAVSSIVDMLMAHKEAGYSGVFVTNHNWYGNTCVDRSLPWKQWVEAFFEPYYIGKEWGDKNDFQVFCGYEASYNGTDFLIYGVTPEWVESHPEIKDASIEEQYRLIHSEGGMVIHAHPYRIAGYIPEIRLFPDCVDGVEGINASHSSPYLNATNQIFDEQAIAYAKTYNLPMTAGSDVHSDYVVHGGMAFKSRLKNEQDYINRVIGREDYLLTNGEDWFDNNGNIKNNMKFLF